MKKKDVIVIGAGASGLLAADTLLNAGFKVTILEARNRAGGRINTINDEKISYLIESGAEFIHGDSPLTTSLLNEAGIKIYPVEGEVYQVKKGRIFEDENFINNKSLLLKKLDEVENDIPFSDFINKKLSDEKYKSIRKSITRFAEGYDAADINKLSTFALREEIKGGGASNSYRPKGGYISLVNLLLKKIKKKNVEIYFSQAVKEIIWKKGEVKIITGENDTFFAKKVLVTVPLGILQSDDEKIMIKFLPKIPEIISSAQLIGYGSIIKIIIQFKEAFWEKENLKLKDLSFMISDTPPVQAWWTQYPQNPSLLTGWMTGPQAEEFFISTDQKILEKTIELLSKIFGLNEDDIKNKIKSSKNY